MPKKKRKESASEQGERFKKEAQKLIDDGELNPTEGDQAIKSILAVQRKRLDATT